MTVTVNYLAVVVAAAIGFVLGWIWYSPLFGKSWVAARGYTAEQQAEAKQHAARGLIVVAVSLLFMAWALAVIGGYLHLASWLQGLKLGVLAWFGFLLTVGMIEAAMSVGRRFAAFWIDAIYWLLTAVLMAVVVSVWH